MRFIALLLVAFLAGCAANINSDNYSVGSVGKVNRGEAGTIVSVRAVKVDRDTGVGGVAGAALGGIGGSAIGKGSRANLAGAIGGALVGAFLGSAAEGAATNTSGYEYVVAMRNGSLLTVTQGTDTIFQEGEHVIILEGNPARVIRDPRNGRQ